MQLSLNNLTVVIACKNRNTNIQLCLASINGCSAIPIRAVVVDFGSALPISTYVPKYSWLDIIRINRKTKLFHKARALNIGIKSVNTKYLCVTDADQLFAPNFFDALMRKLLGKPRLYVMCKTHFLKHIPKYVDTSSVVNNYKKLLTLSKKTTPKLRGEGCCQATTTRWFKQVRGYEEQFIGFSGEDSDVNIRAVKSGLKKVWIHHATSMIHLPHPKTGVYYSAKHRVHNRELYVKRARSNCVIANLSGKWGVR